MSDVKDKLKRFIAEEVLFGEGTVTDGAGADPTAESAEAKVFISEASIQTHMEAMQIRGGYGYMTEFEIERALRDVLGGTIYSGTSAIQTRLIARRLGL